MSKQAGGAMEINDTEFDDRLPQIVKDLTENVDNIHSVLVITVNKDGVDKMQILGDLEMLRDIAALAIQQITFELATLTGGQILN